MSAPAQPPSIAAIKNIVVEPNTLTKVVLPIRELDCGTKPNDYKSPGTCLSSNAFRIRSTSPIIVYQFNVFANAFSNDASLLLPASPHAARTTASAHPTRRSTTMTRTLLRGRRADKRRPPTDAIARAPHSSAEYGGAG